MAEIILTGFEPFDNQDINPSWETVRLVPQQLCGMEVEKVKLPVSFTAAPALLREVIAEHNPYFVFCVGQAGGRSTITPEFVALNYMHARIPDCDGYAPQETPILAGETNAFFATVPVHKMVLAMQHAHIPASVSYSAGTYVCNTVMYTLLHEAARYETQQKTGLQPVHRASRGTFIHLPYLPEQVAHGEGTLAQAPSMALETMVAGLTAALEAGIAGV